MRSDTHTIFLRVSTAKKIINPFADSIFMKRRIAILSMFVVLVLLFGCTNEVNEAVDEAVDNDDPSVCRELDRESDVKECYSLVAEKTNDPEVCKQSTDNDNCITSFAIVKGSIKYCDMSTDTVAKYSCVASVTGDQTGRALDEIILDWRSKGAISKCKGLCEQPYHNCMENGYSTLKSEEEVCTGKIAADMDDYHYCMDLAEEKHDTHKLGCYDDRTECEAGCMPKED